MDGYEAIRLLVARGPWSANLAGFHQHLLFGHCAPCWLLRALQAEERRPNQTEQDSGGDLHPLVSNVTKTLLMTTNRDFCAVFTGLPAIPGDVKVSEK